MENVKVYQLNECDAIAAESLEQARDYYLKMTGLNEDEAFYDYEPTECSLSQEVWEDETRARKQTLQEIIEELWKGEPFIAFSTEY